MYIGQGSVIFLQVRYKQPHASENGQPHREASLAETQPMHRSCAENITVRNSIGWQTRYSFSNQKRIAFLHALAQIAQELFNAAAHIAFQRCWTDPDLAIANLQWEHCNVIATFCKTATGGQVKAPMVPVAAKHTI